MIPVFDGHNDTLLALLESPSRSFTDANGAGHLDLVRAREGGFVGGLFAMFAPDRNGLGGLSATPKDAVARPHGPIDAHGALHVTLRMFALLRRLEADGHLRIATNAEQVEVARQAGVLAAVPHIEGAEAVLDEDVLEILHALGLRSLGLVWSRPNAYGTGVPFGFPASPDVGAGLTSRGIALVEACDRLRIVVDVSHLNEAGFWDVVAASTRPFVASHSNAHALAPSSRNLTDAQLDAIAERDGLVGLNFGTPFLRGDGRADPETSLEVMVRHAEYLVARVGEDRVGLGSDFDGVTIPNAVGDVAGLPRLADALRRHGWDEARITKVFYGNWLALMRRVHGA